MPDFLLNKGVVPINFNPIFLIIPFYSIKMYTYWFRITDLYLKKRQTLII